MDIRVLLVCPDGEAAGLVLPVLTELGMKVEPTNSLARGQQLLQEERFDAVVFDYHDDRPGSDFLAALRQTPKNRTTMLIAIVGADFNVRPVFGLGASFVLYRPLSLERLRLSLRAASDLLKRERRRSRRVPVRSIVKVSYPGQPEFETTLNDISESGTSVAAAGQLPRAGKVYCEFVLPGQHEPVRLSGEVAWQDSSGLTGIRFLDVPQASRRLLKSWHEKTGAGAKKDQANGDESSVQPARGNKNSVKPANSNRRSARRFPCRVGAEVFLLRSSVPNRCTLSDMSEGGCYVEMPCPFPCGSEVEILVRTHDSRFKIQGEVLAAHPGFGMGVRFQFRDSSERVEILRLLGALAASQPLNVQML